MELLRRDFILGEEDTEYLNALEKPWESIIDNKNSWVLIHEFKIPTGYNTETAVAAIMIPESYPMAGLDMVYFHPVLSRLDGKQIPNTDATEIINGVSYQRWSRHRTGENPWRPEIDSLSTQLSLVEEWLMREFRR